MFSFSLKIIPKENQFWEFILQEFNVVKLLWNNIHVIVNSAL